MAFTRALRMSVASISSGETDAAAQATASSLRKKRGDRGEEAVAEALERRGCAILERQYRCRWGEIER